MVKLLSVSFVRQSRFIPVRLLFRHILTRTDTLGTEKHSAPLPTSKEKKATTKISAPLSLLPLGLLIKSYLISFLSSSPLLLTPSLRLLSIVANSRLPFLDPDRNPILRYALKKTIYSHFCAGENLKEVRKTTSVLKALGYSGVILAHGREIVLGHYDILKAREKELDLSTQEDVEIWKQRNLSTVRLVGDTDLVALKLTGAGLQVSQQLAKEVPPSDHIRDALMEICDLAREKGVRILIDAEHHFLQAGIDNWSLRLQKDYNRDLLNKAVVYGTYQAYLRSTPETLSQHLSLAMREGFVLGVKLVRGAYISSDPRHFFWNTKGETDRTYDAIMRALLRREYTETLKKAADANTDAFPEVNLVLATHNHSSVRQAMEIQRQQSAAGKPTIELCYGQLMGMADEVGCEIVGTGRVQGDSNDNTAAATVPKAYKYVPWGSVGECMRYLVRRGEENRDALERTEGRRALAGEISRRALGR